jgi:copper chaperone
MEIQVENIKCGGCAGTITKKINSIFDTTTTEVDIEKGIVSVSIDEGKKIELSNALLKLGYPETGSVEGLKAAAVKAKSFVSCATGKINK